MSRQYRIIMIALGEGSPEDYGIVLTEEVKKAIEWYEKNLKKPKKKAGK